MACICICVVCACLFSQRGQNCYSNVLCVWVICGFFLSTKCSIHIHIIRKIAHKFCVNLFIYVSIQVTNAQMDLYILIYEINLCDLIAEFHFCYACAQNSMIYRNVCHISISFVFCVLSSKYSENSSELNGKRNQFISLSLSLSLALSPSPR